jgi:hypothetical protein
MTDIFREVDEEVRRDKAAEFWKKHGTKIIAAAILFVAGIAGWQFWQAQLLKTRAAQGASFELAIADANADKPEAQGALTAIAGGQGSYAGLARFRLATELARAAKDEAARTNAVSAFETLVGDASLPAEWRDLARLRAGMLLIDHAPFAEVEKRLTPLVTATGLYRHSAREGIALAAWKAGDGQKALDALQAIILDSESPQALRQRAEILLAVVRSGPIRAN